MFGSLEPLSLSNAKKIRLQVPTTLGRKSKTGHLQICRQMALCYRHLAVAYIWMGSINEQHHFGHRLETPLAEF